MIRRLSAELSVSAFVLLYSTLVRSNLEYAMQACSPNLVADADCLEQIQRLVTGLVKGFRQLHVRNDYVGWVCIPYTGVASVETS